MLPKAKPVAGGNGELCPSNKGIALTKRGQSDRLLALPMNYRFYERIIISVLPLPFRQLMGKGKIKGMERNEIAN